MLARSQDRVAKERAMRRYLKRLKELATLRSRPRDRDQLLRAIEAHVFVTLLAYCLQVRLKVRLERLAPELMPQAVLEMLG